MAVLGETHWNQTSSPRGVPFWLFLTLHSLISWFCVWFFCLFVLFGAGFISSHKLFFKLLSACHIWVYIHSAIVYNFFFPFSSFRHHFRFLKNIFLPLVTSFNLMFNQDGYFLSFSTHTLNSHAHSAFPTRHASIFQVQLLPSASFIFISFPLLDLKCYCIAFSSAGDFMDVQTWSEKNIIYGTNW